MTDHSEGLWMPNDIWTTIASFLDNDDLARFRQLCTATQFVGSDVFIMQPLYNRLYALDKTLPALLPQEGALVAFKQAFEKIQARQQFEITYLTKHHPDTMAKPEYLQVFQESATVSLQSLEAINMVLDKINSEIITARIDITSSILHLGGVGITRFPVALFQAKEHVHFWQNLTQLFCNNNQLTTLDVQGLVALQKLMCYKNQLTTLNLQGLVALIQLACSNNQFTTLNLQELAALQQLWCNNNQLTELNVQGLAALQALWCNNNQLTTLDVQRLVALQRLYCENNQFTTLNVQGLTALRDLFCNNNPLKTLILTGVPANVKNQYAELERSLLFKKLGKTDSIEARRAIIRRLGTDYTYKNCLYYCPVYAEKLFAFDSENSTYSFASSALSQASAFLPSFGENQLKIKRDEDEMDIEELSEEPDNQPPAQKRKRK